MRTFFGTHPNEKIYCELKINRCEQQQCVKKGQRGKETVRFCFMHSFEISHIQKTVSFIEIEKKFTVTVN